MAKKKKAKSKKKVHRRQAAHPAVAANTVSGVPAAAAPLAASSVAPPAQAQPVQPTVAVAPAASQGVSASRQSYVGGDVRRIGALAISCVVAELVLWYLFTYTGLGSTVYGLIK